MLELLALATAAGLAARAIGRAIRDDRPIVLRGNLPTPPTVVEPSRPPHVDHPLFSRERGAVSTTQDLVARYLAADPGPLYRLAGVMWPARRFLNKLTLITGRPGSGKTMLMRLMMESVAGLFPVLVEQAKAGLYPGEGKMRWLVVDPTDAYLPLLHQVVPSDVPIVRATPVDACGKRWAIRDDITSPALNEVFQDGLFPESLFQKAGDPFWYNKAREVTAAVVTVYLEKHCKWEFHDLVIPIKYPQFLKPLLMQCAATRGMANHELVGRLGRDIVSSASSVVNRMAIAAALWQKAEGTFSLKQFLDRREVIHFAYTPDLIPCLSGIANAMTRVLVLLGISRNEAHNHTILWLDEGRYLSDLAGLEDLAARGRGAGFGAIFAAQGLPGLINKWGDARVKELTDLVATWVALSSGPETAEAFCRSVGKVEGLLESYGETLTTSVSTTTGVSEGTGGSSSHQEGKTTYTHSWNAGTQESTTYATTYAKSENFQLTVRDAVLPSELTNLPYADASTDEICGFAFNPEVGVFEFAAPFLDHFENLPEPLVPVMPRRPDADQRLLPWTEADIIRLGLEPTPELMAAVAKTWDGIGGAP